MDVLAGGDDAGDDGSVAGESLGTLETLTTMATATTTEAAAGGAAPTASAPAGGVAPAGSEDADEGGDYVPESLANFLNDAEAKLSEMKSGILNESFEVKGRGAEEDYMEEIEREERSAPPSPGPAVRGLPQPPPQLNFGSSAPVDPDQAAVPRSTANLRGIDLDTAQARPNQNVPPTMTTTTAAKPPSVFFSPDTKTHDAAADKTPTLGGGTPSGQFYTPFSEQGVSPGPNPADAYPTAGEAMAAAFDAEGGMATNGSAAKELVEKVDPATPERVALKSPKGDVESVGGSPYLGDILEENGEGKKGPSKEEEATTATAAAVASTGGAEAADASGESLAAYLPPAAAPPPAPAPPPSAEAEDSLEAYLPPAATGDESIDDELFFPNKRSVLTAAGAKKPPSSTTSAGSSASRKAGARTTPRPVRTSKAATPSTRLAGGTAATASRKAAATAAAGAKKPAPHPLSRHPVGAAASARARGAAAARAAAARKKAAAPPPPPPPPRSTTTTASSRAAAAQKAKPAVPTSKRRVAPTPPPPPPRAARSTAASSGKVAASRSAALSARSKPAVPTVTAAKKKPPVARKVVSNPRGSGGAAKPSFMSPTQSTVAHTRRTTADAGRGAKVDVDDAVTKAKQRLRQKQLRERQKAAADRLSKKKPIPPPPPPPKRPTPRAALRTTASQRRRAGATITPSQENARKGAALRAKESVSSNVEKKKDATRQTEIMAAKKEGTAAGSGDVEANPAEESAADDAADDGKENIAAELGNADGGTAAFPAPASNVGKAATNLTVDTTFEDAGKESGPVSGTSSTGSALENAQEKIDSHRSRMELARKQEQARKPKKLKSKEETMKAALYRPFRPKGGSPTKLTVPRPPRLSTSARLGEKYVQPLEDKRDSSFTTGENFTPQLTEPQPFHLSFQSRTPTATKPPPNPTLAESLDDYMRHGLRESTPSSEPFVPKLTIPKPFHLSESPAQALPKSRVELEEEMMKEFEAHPFRAQPVSSSVISGGAGGVPKVTKRELTAPEPFRLCTEDRGAHASHPPPPTTEEMLAEECRNQFHARPMPDLSYQAPAGPRDSKAQQLTTPEPFRLRSVQRHEVSQSHAPPPTPDEVELTKQFHAKPVPASMYRAPSSVAKRDAVERTRTVTTPRAPRLSTSTRMTDTKRREMEERGFHNAEERARERERSARLKQREDMREAIEKASGYQTPRSKGPTVPRPFNFESDTRHEAHRADLEERMMHELEEIKSQAKSFRARPAPSSTRRPRPPSSRKREAPERVLTEPEPFHLKSMQRHNVAQQELLVQMEAEEEERRRLAEGVKATPIPRSTYKRPPSTPRAPAELVQPVGPQLMTEKQSRHRREFDMETRKRMEAELLEKKRQEEAKMAEIDREIQELRRLPVSEGGLMQVANPINAVFHGKDTSFQSGGSLGSVPRAISVQTPL